ncbi:hypothetical protein NST99_29555 [Paenibacillus sp. FSL L8-0470]|uniref:hypothetical protein n=1 Tax=unclassified Paenibacillus TaxID=185978 RepID=UPI0030F8B6F9
MNLILKKITAVLLVPLLTLPSGCMPSGKETADLHATAAPRSTATAADVSGGVDGMATPPPERSFHPENRAGLIPLDWQRVEEAPVVKTSKGLPSGSKVILQTRLDDFGGIQVTVYTQAKDDDYVYADLDTSKGHFSLGFVGTYNYRKVEDIQVEVTNLFKDRVLKITGGLGANNSLSNYYGIDNKGTPAEMLRIDTGHTRELDVDADGYREAVAAHGTPMTAYVYRYHSGYAEFIYLNDALQANSVVLRDDLVYEASDVGGEKPREYRISPEGMILLASSP